MLSRVVCCLTALSFALAPSLAAKTVYIPLTGQDFVGSDPLEVVGEGPPVLDAHPADQPRRADLAGGAEQERHRPLEAGHVEHGVAEDD